MVLAIIVKNHDFRVGKEHKLKNPYKIIEIFLA